MVKRIIWIVLDSVGMGELPDAADYGDEGSNTIGNISKKMGGLKLPNMVNMGLGNIEGMEGLDSVDTPSGAFARMAEASNGKDTIIGHWEMAGIITEKPFPTYPDGFPPEVMDAFEKAIGRQTLANTVSSGTVILKELGEEHVKTGYPIIYTSADSVFQIAAHEEVISVKELYEMCEIARNILVGEHQVARVIARPFIGEVGNFSRTANRHDYAVTPPSETVLDKITKKGLDVLGVGKIVDIFNGQGVTDSIHTKSNDDGIDRTIEYMKQNRDGMVYTNLVDFDMKWGHRNDPEAYGAGLEAFDSRLAEITAQMTDTDVLFITADHGCDPTTVSTDHSREYVPLLVYGKPVKAGADLKTRSTFADIGQTIASMLGTEPLDNGTSFLETIS